MVCSQHAENAAEAFVGVLGHPHTLGKVYNVCPEDMHSWGDYYRVGMSICCGSKNPTVPIVTAPTDVLISAGAASIAIKDNFAHNRVLTPARLCRDVPDFRAGGKGGGVRLAVGLRRMVTAMDAGLLPRRGPAGVLTGLPGERTWASALTVVDMLTSICAGLTLAQPDAPMLATVGVPAEQRVRRIGFCGTGKQAAVLASSVTNTQLGGVGFDIVGVCDTNLAAAQRFADKFGPCSKDGQGQCLVTTDVAGLCADGRLDGIIIATPPSVRLGPITAAAEAKAATPLSISLLQLILRPSDNEGPCLLEQVPIFLEKPPAIAMDEARQCLEVRLRLFF